MGRSVSQRLAQVRAAKARATEFVSLADLDRQVGLLAAALGTPSKPGPPQWVTEDGVTRLAPGEPTAAVPPTNRCAACQAWAQHFMHAFAAEGGPLRGVPAQPPCWGTHAEVA